MSNLAKISSNQVPIKARKLLTKAILKEFKRLNLDPNIPAEKDQLSDLIRDSESVQDILEKHAPNFRIKALNDFLRTRLNNPKGKNLIQLTPQGTDKGNIRRAELSRQPGGEEYSRRGSLEELLKTEKTKEFRNSPIIQTYDDAVIEKFFYEVHRDTLALKNKLRKANEGLDRNDPKRLSWGHLNRLSRSVDTPENVFLELLSENVAKGDNYMENEDAMLAIGNPTKEGKGWLKNWERVFLSWADKPENGGTGRLAQRGDYDDALEKQFRDIGGDQYNKLSLKEQADKRNQINDLIHVEEQKKGFKPEGLKGDDFRRNFDENAQRQIDEINAGYDRQRKSGDHPINTALNWMGIGAKGTLEELPISGEAITMAKTAKSLGEGDFVRAAQHIVGSTKTTTSPFNIKRTPEAQDVKIDKLWRGAESYTKGTTNRLLFDAGETLLSR